MKVVSYKAIRLQNMEPSCNHTAVTSRGVWAELMAQVQRPWWAILESLTNWREKARLIDSQLSVKLFWQIFFFFQNKTLFNNKNKIIIFENWKQNNMLLDSWKIIFKPQRNRMGYSPFKIKTHESRRNQLHSFF